MRTESNSFLGIKFIDLSDDTTVTAGNTNTQTLQPTNGQLYRIIGINYASTDPAGSGSGNQSLSIGYQNMSDSDGIGKITSNTGSSIYITQMQFLGTSEAPSSAALQYDLLHSSICSYSQPIDFIYKNDTDVSKTGTRRLLIMVEVYKEVL